MMSYLRFKRTEDARACVRAYVCVFALGVEGCYTVLEPRGAESEVPCAISLTSEHSHAACKLCLPEQVKRPLKCIREIKGHAF